MSLQVRTPAGRILRVGHRGAAALAPGNTIPALAAALEQGVDMIEFDVLRRGDGALVLAHSEEEVGRGSATLDDALRFLADHSPAEIGIDLDLKWHGFESQVVEALRRHDLLDRALVSSFFPASLREVRRLEPGLPVGISYPWDRRGLAERRLLAPVVRGAAAGLRLALPHRIGGMLASAGAAAAMIHFSVLSSAAVERCHRLGASVFAWTVDDRAVLEAVVGAGVDGVISNDPRIFESVLAAR